MNIEKLRERLADAQQRVRDAADAIEGATEDSDLDALRTALDTAQAEAERAQGALTLAEDAQRAREAFPVREAEASAAQAAGHAAVEVVREAYTYTPVASGFFADLIRVKDGDVAARDRLVRNNAQVADELAQRALRADGEMRARLEVQARAINSSATSGGEFVPPIWLNDQYEPLLRAGRAFADQCMGMPLPPGTNSINVPKITTGAATAVQTDGNTVQNTDQVTTSVTAAVQTIAGRTVASYQLIDMGQPGMDGVIYLDLLADYWRQLDAVLIDGSVTNAKGVLNVSSINAVTYTAATPTGYGLWPYVFQGKSGIEKNAYAGVDFSLWHPSTWNWFLSTLDSQNRPLALATTGPAFNAMAQFNPNAQGIAGNIGGIPVVVDANVPVNKGAGTNEARIVLANRRTLFLYEGSPTFKVADQTSIANLQYQFVMYGYYACAFGRQPKMISALSGTGLVVQSGF